MVQCYLDSHMGSFGMSAEMGSGEVFGEKKAEGRVELSMWRRLKRRKCVIEVKTQRPKCWDESRKKAAVERTCEGLSTNSG